MSSNRRRRKRDPFEFDAPKFKDFNKTKYQSTKIILERILFKRNSTTDEFTITDLIQNEFEGNLSSDMNDEWFCWPHSSHEPTSPLSPPGPLISPETSKRTSRPNPIHITAKTPIRTIIGQDENPMYMSPNVSIRGEMTTTAGLKSKPIRVLARESPVSQVGGFDMSDISFSTGKRSSIFMMASDISTAKLSSSRFRSDAHMITSPIRKFVIENQSVKEDEGRSSLLLSEDNWTIGRISSLPSLEGWISTSNLESKLESPFKEEIKLLENVSVLESPKKETIGMRKFGMASRPERVQINADPSNSSVNPSPTLKRMKTETSFFTPLPTQPPEPLPSIRPKNKSVKIEELKKILAEHNQRLRPRKR